MPNRLINKSDIIFFLPMINLFNFAAINVT